MVAPDNAMRFGICTDQNLPFETLVERWQLFERLGFDSVWDCDHFNQTSNETGPYFEGRYYRLSGAYVRPQPVQQPRPPFTFGAHGPRMLKICAEFADTWNSFGSVAEIAERNRILDQHCAEIGRDSKALRRSYYGWSSQMEVQGMPDFWSSVGAFEEVVGRYSEVGISEVLLDQTQPDQFEVMEKVVADVLPRLRGAAG